MHKLSLLINGKKVAFTSASVKFSLEQLAHTFSAVIPDINIKSPLPVKFQLSGKTIFSGQIDSVGDDVSSKTDNVTINGRSTSANLIDSRIKLDAIYNQKFDQLLNAVASPFGLAVRNNVPAIYPLPEIPEFQINAESPLANLAQIAKQQNLMLIENNGTIVIEQPGQHHEENIVLEVGVNTQSLSIKRNFQAQFYRYEVQGAWDDAQAVVIDKRINPCREKVIIADKLHNEASCKTRAEFEKNMAWAKGFHATASLPGLHPLLTGKAVNKTIKVKNPKKSLDETLLIKSIAIAVSDKQENTVVELFRPFGA